MKLFLSCVSKEFASYRTALAAHLTALKPGKDPIEVRIQEDFSQGPRTLLERLTDYIRECDAVVHLVGEVCGELATEEHVRKLYASLGWTQEAPLPKYSFTQWEAELALRLGRELYCYLAGKPTPRDTDAAAMQSTEEAILQKSYQAELEASGKHYDTFESHHDLLQKVLRDLGLSDRVIGPRLPFASIAQLFVGRDEFLEKLRTTLGNVQHRGLSRAAAITGTATAAVYGLGGIGKTRAAIEYGYRYAHEYTAVLFAVADTPQALETNLAKLSGAAVLNLPEQVLTATHEQMAAVLRWLQQHPGWLLILDNVDSEEAAEAAEKKLAELAGAGHVIITSRLSRWRGEVEPLDLDLLDEASSAAYLLESTEGHRRIQTDDQNRAHELAQTLDRLALALEQAAAYITERECSFADYLERWQASRQRLIGYHDDRATHYPISVAVTWLTTFEHLSQDGRRLLEILAWLAPEPVPLTLMSAEGGPFAAERAEPVSEQARAEFVEQAEAALANLRRYSMARSSTNKQSFSVHRLVQDVTRMNLPETGQNFQLITALRWLNGGFQGDADDVQCWPVLDALAAHARSVTSSADCMDIPEPTARLMNALGQFLQSKAQWAKAEPLMRRALEIGEKSYGPEHPKIVALLTSLAFAIMKTNRVAEADILLRRALAIDEKIYGPEHPEVATGLINLSRLASMFSAGERFKVAEPIVRRALSIDEKSYGPEHSNVARDLKSLADLLIGMDRFADAEPLMRRALAIYEKIYGPEHLFVAIHQHNLAILLQEMRRSQEAETLYRCALDVMERTYGPNHPDVATCLSSLAGLLGITHRLVETEPLRRRVLEIHENIYGPEHPEITTALYNLAGLYRATKRTQEAEQLYRRALDVCEKSYGPEHPEVAVALTGLTLLLLKQKRLEEAGPLILRAFTIQQRFRARTGRFHSKNALTLVVIMIYAVLLTARKISVGARWLTILFLAGMAIWLLWRFYR